MCCCCFCCWGESCCSVAQQLLWLIPARKKLRVSVILLMCCVFKPFFAENYVYILRSTKNVGNGNLGHTEGYNMSVKI